MKILHTSDWHVGKTLRGRSREDEHRAALAEIVQIASDEAVDLVLVVGDLFETQAPQPHSEALVYRTLLALADTGAQVAVLAGNHDNERRLAAVEPLLRRGKVVTQSMVAEAEAVLRFRARSTGEEAHVALLPWVRKQYVVRAADTMAKEGADAIGQFVARVGAIVAHVTRSFGPETVNILAAHLAVLGGEPGEGVMKMAIEDFLVPGTIFGENAHYPQYVALGHYHRANRVLAPSTAWYCGSPLQLDFGESDDRKAVLIVEASPGRPAQVRQVPLHAGRRLRTLDGTLEELEEAVKSVGDEYLRIRVRGQARAGLADEVREMFEHAVDVMVLDEEEERDREMFPSRSGRSPHELFEEYLREKKAFDQRVLDLFDELLEQMS